MLGLRAQRQRREVLAEICQYISPMPKASVMRALFAPLVLLLILSRIADAATLNARVAKILELLGVTHGRNRALAFLKMHKIHEVRAPQLLGYGPTSQFHAGRNSNVQYAVLGGGRLAVVKRFKEEFLHRIGGLTSSQYYEVHFGYGLGEKWGIGPRYYGALQGHPSTVVMA